MPYMLLYYYYKKEVEMASGASDRRRQKRVKMKASLTLRHSDKEHDSITNNMSLLGASVNTKSQILPGTRVGVHFDIPEYKENKDLAGEVKGEGAIVRCDPSDDPETPNEYEVGVFFANFVGTDEQKLSKYLDFLVKQEEKEIRQWAKQYRARIEKRKKAIAQKKRLLAKKRADRVKKRALKKKQRELAKLKAKKDRAAQRAAKKASKKKS